MYTTRLERLSSVSRCRFPRNYRCQFQDIVREVLETVFQLFNNTQKIKETYGCRPFTEQDAIQLRLAATEGTNPLPSSSRSYITPRDLGERQFAFISMPPQILTT